MQGERSGWKRLTGVICDRKISARTRGKVYETEVRPAMLYWLEAVTLTQREEAVLQVEELKMLRFFARNDEDGQDYK